MPSVQQTMSDLLVEGDIDGICRALQDPAFAGVANKAAKVACATFLSSNQSEAQWCRVLTAALDAGTPVDFDGGAGSLLSFAARVGGVERMRLLFARGATANPPASSDIAGTPLMHAVEHSQVKSIEVLLDHGANIHARDRTGQTVLFWAVRENSWQVQELLLAKGADLFAVDNRGHTLLHEALRLATSGSTQAAKREYVEDACEACARLIRLGLSPETRDGNGVSAVEDAARYDPSLQRRIRETWAEVQAEALSQGVAPATAPTRRRTL